MATDPDPTASIQPNASHAASIPSWVLEDVPFGIGVLHVPELTFVYSNRLYETWYQAEKRPIVGKRLEEALSAAPQVVSIFRDVAKRGEPAHFHDARFVGLRDRPVVLPGDVTHWDWSIWPLKDPSGAVTYLLVSGYDVSAQALDRLRLQRSHEEGIRAMVEVSRVAGTRGSIQDFFGELSTTVAGLVGAGKVLFARAEDGAIVVQPSSHGFDDALLAGITVPCTPEGTGLADRIVFQDQVFKASIDSGPEFDAYRAALSLMEVSDAIAVSWRAGDLSLGLVAAFNSIQPGGFSDEDVHLLKTASLAAGLVWQHRQTQAMLAQAQSVENERLRDSAHQLAELEERKAEFLRFASHEMRGPLSVISAYASLVEEGAIAQPNDSISEANRVIGVKARELNRIVDQILAVSRLEDPTLELNLTTLDLREILSAAIAQTHPTRYPAHRLMADVGREAIYVRADRDQVLMIVANLLDNAIKYSPSGGEIHCGIMKRGYKAEIYVSDQGIGIAADDLPKLFSRFSRVGGATTEAIAGTGLGLYLCREAAHRLSGDVRVESQAGRGSTFTLELPAAN